MYLIFSTAAAFAAILAAINEMRRAQRLQLRLLDKTTEAEAFERTSKITEEQLRTEQVLNCRTAERCSKLETALRESEDTVCRLRQQLQTARDELTLSEEEHDACTHKLTDAQNQIEQLKKDRHALEVAIITQEECAAHWKEECDKQMFYRLSAEGRVMREFMNILNYDGSPKYQAEIDLEEYPDEN